MHPFDFVLNEECYSYGECERTSRSQVPEKPWNNSTSMIRMANSS